AEKDETRRSFFPDLTPETAIERQHCIGALHRQSDVIEAADPPAVLRPHPPAGADGACGDNRFHEPAARRRGRHVDPFHDVEACHVLPASTTSSRSAGYGDADRTADVSTSGAPSRAR